MYIGQKGFKPIELIAGVAVLILISLFTFPQIMRSRENARIAEVKTNIHEIQIACERYCVDSGGAVPLFLVGADRGGNILQSYIDLSGNGISRFPVDGMTPFAYSENSESPENPKLQFTCDPLLASGYLAYYPTNPFADRGNRFGSLVLSDKNKAGIFPYGGPYGDLMFDLGFGWGDTPQTEYITVTGKPIDSPPEMHAPGNFYYHPVFHDMQSVYYHYAAQYAEVRGTANPEDFYDLGFAAHEAEHYELYGFASQRYNRRDQDTRSMDEFSAMPSYDRIPESADLKTGEKFDSILNSSVQTSESRVVETTGYNELDFDPWIGGVPIEGYDDGVRKLPETEELISGPDGIGDWVVIAVSGGTPSVGFPEPYEFKWTEVPE